MTRPTTHSCRDGVFSGCTVVFPGLGRARAARPGGNAARNPLALGDTARRLHCLADRCPGAVDRHAAARMAEIGRRNPALTPEARAVIERARIDARKWKDLP